MEIHRWIRIGIWSVLFQMLSLPLHAETATQNPAPVSTPETAIATHAEARLDEADIRAALPGFSPIQIDTLKDLSTARENLAVDMLLRRVLAERARKEGMLSDPILQARVRVATDKLLSDAYLEANETKSIDEKKLEQLARDEYRAYPERYRKEEILARHILIRSQASCPSSPRQIAEDLLLQLKAGASFTDLAMKHSDDSASAAKGGDLGWISRGKTVKPFEEALFAMKESGTYSDVVETTFGFHIIQMLERKPPALPAFDDVKTAIMDSARLKKRQQLRADLLSSLKTPGSPSVEHEKLQSLINSASPKTL